MKKVMGVSVTTKRKHDLEIQETRRIKITHHYSLKEKKIDIEAQKIALEKEVQQQRLALQKREMAHRESEPGVYPGYQAPDFLFVFYKSSSTEKPSRPPRQKSSTFTYTPSPLSQAISFKDKTLPLPTEPRETRSLSWDIPERKFNSFHDKESQDTTHKSRSVSPRKFTKYGLLEETEASIGPYFLDKQ